MHQESDSEQSNCNQILTNQKIAKKVAAISLAELAPDDAGVDGVLLVALCLVCRLEGIQLKRVGGEVRSSLSLGHCVCGLLASSLWYLST